MTDRTPASIRDEDTSSSPSLGHRIDTLLHLVREANNLNESGVSHALALTHPAVTDAKEPPGVRRPMSFTSPLTTPQHIPTQVLPISRPDSTNALATSTNPLTDVEVRRARLASNDLNPTASTYTPVQGDM